MVADSFWRCSMNNVRLKKVVKAPEISVVQYKGWIFPDLDILVLLFSVVPKAGLESSSAFVLRT
jgi:hypothetical protein